MQQPSFTPQTLIAEVLERQPEVVYLLIAHGTDCVGCVMAPFCTLGEMSLHYAVDLDEFLGELGELGARQRIG
jgi:hybrid cluster-associated redox disulfide protein